MFELSAVTEKATNALYEYASRLGRGDTLDWSVIERLTKFNRYEGRMKAVRYKFAKRLLKERGIALMLSWIGGWKLCTDEEQIIELDRKRIKKARRQAAMRIKENRAIDGSKLSTHLRRIQNMRLEQAKQDRLMLTRSLKATEEASRPTPTNQRRPHPSMMKQNQRAATA